MKMEGHTLSTWLLSCNFISPNSMIGSEWLKVKKGQRLNQCTFTQHAAEKSDRDARTPT
jgi:hypothetical protein